MNSNSQFQAEDHEEKPRAIHRRSFLRRIGKAIFNPQKELRNQLYNAGIFDSAQAEQYLQTDSSYLRTIGESGLLFIGKALSVAVLGKLSGKEVGNANGKSFKERNLSTILASDVVNPAIEEFMFRILPAYCVDTYEIEHNQSERMDDIVQKTRWKMGIATSVLFALAHNITRDEKGRLVIASHIPLPQFLGGVYNWYVMRTRGMDHAVIAHMTNNVAVDSISLSLNALYPGKNKQTS